MNIFSDLKTNTVYYSRFFQLRFPQIFETARVNLEANGNKVKLIGGNMNLWIRDWAPIQVDDHFVRFGYKGYSNDGIESGYEDYPWLQVPDKCFDAFKPLVESEIVLDGGGIIRSEKHAVITEKVFIDNPNRDKQELLNELRKILGVPVLIIPVEPGDWLGHADGICKFINHEEILVNDYSVFVKKDPEYKKFNQQLMTAFQSAGLKVRLMPYIYDQCKHTDDEFFHQTHPFADDNNPGYGYYINFTLTKNTIIAPVFGVQADFAAIQTLKECYPKHSIIAVDCAELSYEGGLTNCTSANTIE